MFRVSVDVGGTFTDLVAFDEESGELRNIKVPSVPRSPEEGVMDAFSQFLRGVSPDQVRMVGHATTIATNALLGQVDLELPRVGLITTRGFKDVIEIGRQRRAEVYNLFFQRPPMLVERRFRYEVDERIDHQGEVITPLDTHRIEEIIRDLGENQVESVAVGFLNSYANPVHEQKTLELIEGGGLDAYLSASCLISNEYREYERISTAVVNAALMPIIHTYITSLGRDLRDRGIGSPLYVMQSNGGMAEARVASRRPATIVESGPASGVIAAAWLGELIGDRDIISFDMGGTTAKAGTVRGRVPEVVPEYEVAGKIHMGRLVKGSGYPVRFPFIDLAECSAGGGTIAKLDQGGILQVGPTSAGANPGPACYGGGGGEATITDANLLIGRLNQESLLGGAMTIHPSLAREAYRIIGDGLGLSAEEAAMSVVRIANSMMSKILHIVSVERGYDPRGFTLVAFGGAGPMHVCMLAEELDIWRVVVPPNPGMFSALGLLTADLFHDYTRAIVARAEDVDPAGLEETFRELERDGLETLTEEGIPPSSIRYQRQLDLRYLGQGYELAVEAETPVTEDSIGRIVGGFHRKHMEVYGYSAGDEPVEMVNVRLRAIGLLEKPALKESPLGDSEPIPRQTRDVFFETDGGWVETPVYDRPSIGWRGALKGPAIIEQYDSTTVVYPGWIFESDRFGNLVLRRVAG